MKEGYDYKMNLLQLDKLPVVSLRTVDQIGIVVKDVDTAVQMFANLLGIGPFRILEWPIPGVDPKATYRGRPGNWRMREAFAQMGDIQIELIQPLEGQSVFQDFLDANGPGLHHIRLLTENFEADTCALQAAGLELISSGTGVHVGSQWAYFDTCALLDGVLIELRKKLGDTAATGDWIVLK